MCAVQGVGGELAKGETAAQRLGWYQEVYTIVEQQLQNKRYYICLDMLQLHTIGSEAWWSSACSVGRLREMCCHVLWICCPMHPWDRCYALSIAAPDPAMCQC